MSLYGTTTQDSVGWEESFPIVAGSVGDAYPSDIAYAIPGYIVNGWQSNTSDEHGPDFFPGEAYSWGSTNALTTDPTVGSLPGMVNRSPYASGPVDSNFVENFAMTGEYISIRRRAEGNSGPVGFSDYGSILASALQQSNTYPTSSDRLNVELIASV